MGVEPLDDQPNEALECRLLLLLRGRPDVEVTRGSIDLLDDPEQVLETDLRCPWIGLDVEEEVPLRWFGQGAETSAGVGWIGWDQLEDVLAGHPLLKLQAGLFADPGQLGAGDSLDRPGRLQDGKAGKGRHAGRGQPLRVQATHPGHDGQVVIRSSAIDAHRVPTADPTVVDRVRVRAGGPARESGRDAGIEPSADPSEIGRKVVGAVRVLDPVAGDDIEPLRGDPLKAFKQARVDAHLEDRAGLYRASQLGVRDVVAPIAQHRARAIRTLEQEVGMAAPATIEEGRLEDDVGTATHRLEGRACAARS